MRKQPEARSKCHKNNFNIEKADIVDVVDNELAGKGDCNRSDTLRTIIMSWLFEKGYLNKGGKEWNGVKKNFQKKLNYWIPCFQL
jgi:hypothetical protein